MEISNSGKLYFRHGNGYTPLVRVEEVTITDAPGVSEYPELSLSDGELTFTLHLNSRNKKTIGQVFMLPRWKITEWAFPRKKKRATARRKRKEGKT